MIPRLLTPKLQPYLGSKKALIIVGPRQVGKTTLIRTLTQTANLDALWLSGDDPQVRASLHDISSPQLKTIIGNYKTVVVDEAQRLHNAGLTLKLVTDQLEGVQLLVTGSSALDLAAETKESLVGRKFEFLLLPLSFREMADHHGYLTERSLLEHRMLYGYYPEVVNSSDPALAQRVLNELTEGLMYKDLLMLDSLKKPTLLVKILQALALQMGGEVSYREVGQLVGADQVTVERYISLLEQAYIVFRLSAFSRNLRNEIKRTRKIYFYDNGIRNSILRNFAPLALRQDTGALWENFLMVERLKYNLYNDRFCNAYFWRSTTQQEIDYIEEKDGILHAFEFKWQIKRGKSFPASFLEAYPGTQTATIAQENFSSFLGLEMGD